MIDTNDLCTIDLHLTKCGFDNTTPREVSCLNDIYTSPLDICVMHQIAYDVAYDRIPANTCDDRLQCLVEKALLDTCLITEKEPKIADSGFFLGVATTIGGGRCGG